MNDELEELRAKYVGKLARLLWSSARDNIIHHRGIVRSVEPDQPGWWLVQFESEPDLSWLPTYNFNNLDWILELHPRYLE